MIKKIKKFSVIFFCILTVFILSILPCSAVSVPDYDINDDNYNYYIILKYDNGGETLILSTNKLVVTNNSGNIVLFNKNGNVKIDYLTNHTATLYTSPGNICSIYLENIYSTNYDIYYADSNEVFFLSAPLLNKLLEQVPQGVGEKLTTDMATLTVFGIGLIALLVGLYLVPKVLHKFRV